MGPGSCACLMTRTRISPALWGSSARPPAADVRGNWPTVAWYSMARPGLEPGTPRFSGAGLGAGGVGHLQAFRPAGAGRDDASVRGEGLLSDAARPAQARLSSRAGPASPRRATLCDMRIVTHREMRNQSGDILRHVADGETIQVTNNGQVAALIVPPGTDPLADLVSRGQMRVARNPTSSLRSIVRRKSTAESQAIVADVRGHW